MGTIVVLSGTNTTQILSEDEVIHADLNECKDFDYASSTIIDILQNVDIGGPDQMRLVMLIADCFLLAHKEKEEFEINQTLIMSTQP